jgi:hypothetical protein
VLHEHGCELSGELDCPPRFIRLERLSATLAVDLELEADRRGRHVVQVAVLGPAMWATYVRSRAR